MADYKELICRPSWQFNCGIWQKDTRVYYFKPICQSRRIEDIEQMLRVKKRRNSIGDVSLIHKGS